jgi:hypothetical protein
MWSNVVALFRFYFSWETLTSILKTNNSKTLGDGKSSVLWNSTKNLVDFVKRLKKH